jgi:BNR/Asp-box repeat protein
VAFHPWRIGAAGLAILTAVLVSGPGATATRGSETARGLVRYISSRSPVLGPGRELGVVRPAQPSVPVPVAKVSPGAPAWHLLATIPGAVVRDISFATPRIGYAVAELGQVWKTTDGGRTWTSVLNLGFPYYWYGVDALSTDQVVISGFDNAAFTALARWTDDGGATWSADILLADQGWANRVRFAGTQNGLVVDLVNLDAANKVQLTSTGGQAEGDWTSSIPDPDGGWFGADFTLLPDLTAYISGITECRSASGGANWTCEPPVDPVFDGAVEYVDHQHGWVGGGSISPQVEGWVYRTTDGGATWSERTLHSPWPVRDIEFLTSRIGWAAGGDLFSGVGGMYLTKDGGQTWSLDADTGAEMLSCTSLRRGNRVRVWCAGSTGSFQGVVYGLELNL